MFLWTATNWSFSRFSKTRVHNHIRLSVCEQFCCDCTLRIKMIQNW